MSNKSKALRSRGRKDLACKVCSEVVENVGEEATAVTCWKCVMRSMRGHIASDDPLNS
jgi:hypothetical protein